MCGLRVVSNNQVCGEKDIKMHLVGSNSARFSCRALRLLMSMGIVLAIGRLMPAVAQDVSYVPIAPNSTTPVRLEIQNGQLVLPSLANYSYVLSTEDEIKNLNLLLSYADKSGMFADIDDMRIYLPEIRNYRESLVRRLESERSRTSKTGESGANPDGGVGTQSLTGFEYQRREKWSDGIVYYVFGSDVAGTGGTQLDRQRRFLAACREWEEVADVKFVPWTGQGGTEPRYIRVDSSSDRDQANIGSIGGTPYGQNILFNIKSWNDKFVIVHELGHTLGLLHEHQRPDRDNYITVHADKIRSEAQGAYTIAPVSVGQIRDQYDYESVMHYDPTQGNNSPSARTFNIAQGEDPYLINVVGKKTHLSDIDKASMAALYGPPQGATAMATRYDNFTLILENYGTQFWNNRTTPFPGDKDNHLQSLQGYAANLDRVYESNNLLWQYKMNVFGFGVGSDSNLRVLWSPVQPEASDPNNPYNGPTFSLWQTDSNANMQSANQFFYPDTTSADIAVGPDNKSEALWRRKDGTCLITRNSSANQSEVGYIWRRASGWFASQIAVASDNKVRLLWSYAAGHVAVWQMTPDAYFETETGVISPPGTDFFAADLAVMPDGKNRILWRHTDGRIIIAAYPVSSNTAVSSVSFNPPFVDSLGQYPRAMSITVGSDGKTRLLWNKRHDSGKGFLWLLSPTLTLERSIDLYY